jgi:DNA ligase (NAD+)
MVKISQAILDKYKKLSGVIKYHQHLYHTLDTPEISDEAYDSLVRELLDLEEKYADLKSYNQDISVSERVGGQPLSEFQKVKHEIQQWSFDDIFDFDGLKKWDEKIRRMIEKIP